MSDPKSLAVAFETQRRNRAKQVNKPLPMPLEESEERPSSIAQAILAKRREAALPALEESTEETEEQLEAIEPQEDIAVQKPESPKPFLSRAEAIRAKLKETRGF